MDINLVATMTILDIRQQSSELLLVISTQLLSCCAVPTSIELVDPNPFVDHPILVVFELQPQDFWRGGQGVVARLARRIHATTLVLLRLQALHVMR